jgi:hypothetical protein
MMILTDLQTKIKSNPISIEQKIRKFFQALMLLETEEQCEIAKEKLDRKAFVEGGR